MKEKGAQLGDVLGVFVVFRIEVAKTRDSLPFVARRGLVPFLDKLRFGHAVTRIKKY